MPKPKMRSIKKISNKKLPFPPGSFLFDCGYDYAWILTRFINGKYYSLELRLRADQERRDAAFELRKGRADFRAQINAIESKLQAAQ